MSRLVAAVVALAGLVLLGFNVSRGASGGRLLVELLALVCLVWVLLRVSGIQVPVAFLLLPITLLLLPIVRLVCGPFDCELPQNQQPRYGGADWRGRPIGGYSRGGEPVASPVQAPSPLREEGEAA